MRFLESFIVIACVFSVSLAYIKDSFQVLPFPKIVSSGEQKSARQVYYFGANPLIIDDPKTVCLTDCLRLLNNAFQRSVVNTTEAQEGLAAWKLSPHPEFSAAPVVEESLPHKISQVIVTFTGLADPLAPMVAVNTTLEHYEIDIDYDGEVHLTTHTVWGALHGFETIAQLYEWHEDSHFPHFVVQRIPISIKDEPRFPWRGFLVDCARHYMPMSKLRNLVDTLAAFKMNVLHLHLSDAQSFPMEIPDIPSLAQAAFSPKAVYSTIDMQSLVQYAYERGVMVVPEVDIPAHTASWRFADDDITANCFDFLASRTGSYEENLAALNPASNKTWTAIDTIIKHYSKTFSTSPFTHVGGDEVSSLCWEHATQASAIKSFMKKHGISSYSDLEAYFDHYSQKSAVRSGKTPIVWEDVLQKDAVEKGTIVHAWRSRDTLVSAVRKGNYAITSYPYYLDRQDPKCSGSCKNINWMFSWTYREMYANDPVEGLSEKEAARVLGGEAALWGESVDASNFDAMGIGRLGAFAERFWSPSTVTDPKNFEVRSQRFRCLNVKRGIAPGAGPLSSDFCETAHFFD